MNSINPKDGQGDISLRSYDETIVVRDSIVAVFYSRTTNEVLREMAVATIRKILRSIDHRAFTTYVDYEGNEQDLTPQVLEALFEDRMLGRRRAPNANLILNSSDLQVPSFYLWYNGRSVRDVFDPQTSFLMVWVPRSYYLAQSIELTALFDDIAGGFPVSSGYVSRAFTGDRHQQKQALARRFLTYDIASPLCVSADLGTAAAGAYWLNYLGADLSCRLGGPDNLRMELERGTLIRELPNGVLRVQLTEMPIAGDVNRREDVSAYRKFAAILDRAKVLHVPSKAVYFFDAQGMADKDGMEAWHLRFLR